MVLPSLVGYTLTLYQTKDTSQRTETPIFSNHIALARHLKLLVNVQIDFQFSKHGTKQVRRCVKRHLAGPPNVQNPGGLGSGKKGSGNGLTRYSRVRKRPYTVNGSVSPQAILDSYRERNSLALAA